MRIQIKMEFGQGWISYELLCVIISLLPCWLHVHMNKERGSINVFTEPSTCVTAIERQQEAVCCCKRCMFPIHLHISCTCIQLLSWSTLNRPAFIHLFSSVVVFEFLSFLNLSSVRNSGWLLGDEIIDRMCSLAIKLLANISLWCLTSACWDTRKRIERYQRTRHLLWLPRLMLPRTSFPPLSYYGFMSWTLYCLPWFLLRNKESLLWADKME